MKKVIATIAITLITVIATYAQVQDFSITTESRFSIDSDGQITDTLYYDIPSTLTLRADMNNGYIKVISTDKTESFKIIKAEKQSDGTIALLTKDVNRPTLIAAIMVGKGEIGIVYPQLGMMTHYRTKKK